MAGTQRRARDPMPQQKLHRTIQPHVCVAIRRLTKRIQRGERRPGIGGLRLRPVTEEKLVAAPTAIRVLRLKQMRQRRLQAGIICKTQCS